jgi:hypothetical protein
MSDDEGSTTEKIPAAPSMDEQKYALFLYNEAMRTMLENPTKKNIDAFTEANKHLFEVLDAYRIAKRLLLERALNLAVALKLYKR